MAQISINHLTFCYEGSFDNIFEDVSFSIDTNWKLGFIGRNGKGKTTFLHLLLGEYEYSGSIHGTVSLEYFPYPITTQMLARSASDFLEELRPGCEEWRVLCELAQLNLDAELLYRPFGKLSHGERTKILLAILFSGENDFLLIDEPTNHLDQEARATVKQYLSKKKGFILVSHDRDLLDACIDHVLVLNRQSLEIQSGNFSGWWENKMRKDRFSQAENEKHLREIASLKKSADQMGRWAKKNESTKIGFNPIKEHDRFIDTRAHIGAKTKKAQARVKQFEHRIERKIREKEGLLQDIETPVSLKLSPQVYHKETLLRARDLSLAYEDNVVVNGISFEMKQGERVFLHGQNGCGKSSLIKAIIEKSEQNGKSEVLFGVKSIGIPSIQSGELEVGAGLVVSYINQDTGFLRGSLRVYAEKQGLDASLLFALLRQLDMERVQFEKNLEDFSEGQKKKVLLASSLMTPAHLYIWDEPLNYIDVFSRMQIEELLLAYNPSMLVVDHDVRFREKIATKIVEL